MHIQFLRSKYYRYIYFLKSSLIWNDIKDAYDIILKNNL